MKDNDSVLLCCKAAKEASAYIELLSTEEKNKLLALAADALCSECKAILAANESDLQRSADKPAHLLDRLRLTESRVQAMADGLRQVISLADPIGEVIDAWSTDTGLQITKVRVPLGVLGIIYEARPNVTADAIGLSIKTGNALVLRGSKDAIASNKAIVEAIKARFIAHGYNSDFIQLIEDTTHEGVQRLMKLRDYVDVLIPRGSANLIRSVIDNASIPVIETGTGNCHAYIEKTADIEMAKNIILNGKLQRPSVCNALESLLVDESIAKKALPEILGELHKAGVTVYGCEKTRALCPFVLAATETDYATEYLDLKISCKVVNDTDEAIAHINRYSSKHSEVIVTNDKQKAELFLKKVDSAAVYVNASTRFTDGFEFGFGAEMGISTQKLHARGPLGLRQLTSEKYRIVGQGQVRK